MSKEALKLALEALKMIDEAMPFPVAKLAQAAIKEALAQPEEKYQYGTPLLDSMTKDYVPLQRTWVGLTDEEIKTIEEMALTKRMAIEMAIAIVKEKNT